MAASNKLRVPRVTLCSPQPACIDGTSTFLRTAALLPLSRPLLRAIGARGPPAQAAVSSAPRPYIGYISSQWHTRRPQPPEQLAAIS